MAVRLPKLCRNPISAHTYPCQVPLPHPPLPRRRMVSIGTPWNGLHSIGYHSIRYHCYPFQWSGMDTMALDTNRSTTGGAVRGGYARSRSWRARIRRREWFFGRPEAGKWVCR